MTEELKNLIEDYKKTNWKSLLREDRGDYHLKEIKPNLDFIKNFFDEIINNPYFESSFQSYTGHLDTSFKNFNALKQQINGYQNDSEKQNIIDQVRYNETDIFNNLKPLHEILKTKTRYDSDSSSKVPHKVVAEYRKATKEMQQELEKIKKLQSQYSEQTVRKESKRYGDFFKAEAENNKKLSIGFGGVLVLVSIVVCFVAYHLLKLDPSIKASSFIELLIKGNILNNIFIFSILLLIISVISREYLALRHQFTLNTHRHNALNSHNEILSSIKETASESDKEISNAILLELTKSMFNPQDTGFIKNQKNTASDSKIVEISKSIFSNSKN